MKQVGYYLMKSYNYFLSDKSTVNYLDIFLFLNIGLLSISHLIEFLEIITIFPFFPKNY